MTTGPPRPLPGYPEATGLVSDSCSSSPSLGLRLPSDSASRRTPWPALAVPVITARRGLAPPTHITCLTNKKRGEEILTASWVLEIMSSYLLRSRRKPGRRLISFPQEPQVYSITLIRLPCHSETQIGFDRDTEFPCVWIHSPISQRKANLSASRTSLTLPCVPQTFLTARAIPASRDISHQRINYTGETPVPHVP